ncbi:hypothetical protein ACEPPN_018621 [Leptodophora sp. 'Broadleaf-Isolate-01']
MSPSSINTNIIITGAGGFIGQALAAALLTDPSSSITTLTLTDIIEPPSPVLTPSTHTTTTKIRCIKADLTDKKTCDALFTSDLTTVYLLHGLMSGAAEANLDLGLRVNVDSTRTILDILRKIKPGGIQVIFPSSLAVFGPSSDPTTTTTTTTHNNNNNQIITESTIPRPSSSYGAEKLICEILLSDFSRRGLLDGRIVRLPTIIVRPGLPSGAASSFCSGIIREPLRGERAELPVSKDLELWVCSTRTIVANLIHTMRFPQEMFKDGSVSRVINLPGITVTVGEMLRALKEVGGESALALVEEKRDVDVERIVGSWPARFDTSKASDFGFLSDGDLKETIRNYIEDYGTSLVAPPTS